MLRTSPELTRVRIYYQGPKEGVNFIVDEMSVTPDSVSTSNVNLDSEIDRLRKSNINIQWALYLCCYLCLLSMLLFMSVIS